MNPLWVIAQGAAITLVFCLGSLFARVRTIWPDFLNCPLCVGVWVGAALGSVTWDGTASGALFVLGIGCLTGIAALAVRRMLDALESVSYMADVIAENRKTDGREE